MTADIAALGDDEMPVAVTTVGAPAIRLDPGTYRVVVRSEPALEFDEVTLEAGAVIDPELAAAQPE